MSTPATPAQRPATAPTRSEDGRIIAGVASGLGRWLSVDPVLLRLLFAATAAVAGIGLIAYAALAVALPPGGAPGQRHRRPLLRRLVRTAGFTLQLAGALLLILAAGLAPSLEVISVATLTVLGGALLWRAVTGLGEAGETPRTRAAAVGRVGAGFALLGAGALLSLRPGAGSAGVILIVAAIVAGAVTTVLAPSLRRARREAEAQHLERVRADERAAVAARLHDSVLQTLAVIQHLDDASPRVQGIARSQERELRAWLYGGEQPGGPQTFASALRHAIEEIELLHGVKVDLVQPADAPLDGASEPLVNAAREAIVNAARHAGVTDVSVLAHVTPAELAVYVRDRGSGFDVDQIAPDRRGVRDSIIARMQRAGGSANVTSTRGGGTEVELRLPRDRSGSTQQ